MGHRYPNFILLVPSVSFWSLSRVEFNWKTHEGHPLGVQLRKGEKWIYRSKQKVSSRASDLHSQVYRCRAKRWWRALSLGSMQVRKGNHTQTAAEQCSFIAGPLSIVHSIWARVKEPGEHFQVFSGCQESVHHVLPFRPSLFGRANSYTTHPCSFFPPSQEPSAKQMTNAGTSTNNNRSPILTFHISSSPRRPPVSYDSHCGP